MNNKIFLCLFIILSSSAFADEAMLNRCELEGVSYGNGKGADKIASECFDQFYSKANSNAIKESSDKKILVLGHRNIVFIEKDKKRSILAGEYTLLKEVVAVAIDEINDEVAILIGSGDVLFFPSNIGGGNIAPLRILRSQELEGATDLIIDTNSDEVIVTNPSQGNLLFFSRKANYLARKGQKKLSVTRKFKGITEGMVSLGLDKKRKLEVIDKIRNEKKAYQLK